jgi:hypothetical protein
MAEVYSVQQVLELACAAQRTNGSYIKEDAPVYSEDGAFLYLRHTNKMQMLCTLDHRHWTADPKDAPMPLKVLAEDAALAEEIKSYYRRLMFAAVKGDNEFQTEVNSILNADTMPKNKMGFVACLPSVYARDKTRNDFKRNIKNCEDHYLGEVDSIVVDKDCEIIECSRSKNFDAYNINAIIQGVLVSWFAKQPASLGPAVLQKAKVKEHRHHWLTKKAETRLNYVKIAQ